MFTLQEQKKIEHSAVELKISIEEIELQKHRAKALKHLGEHAEVAGFRKGHVPENILVSKFGEQTILEEAAEHAIEANYADIVMEAKIQPVAHPKIIITKIAAGNPLEFTMTIDVMPTFTLPDYKSIAQKIVSKKEAVEVTQKDVDNVLEEVKKYHTKEGEAAKEIDDDLVKTLGDFKDVEDFKTKMRENIRLEKEMKRDQKTRVDVLDGIAEKSDMEIPNTFIERELDQMMAEFSHELSRMGQTLESYTKHTKKSEEEIRTEWRQKARRRVAQELILDAIAKQESIKPKSEDVETEVQHMLERYPETPKERIVSFVEDMLTKQEVFKFLEGQK